MLTKEEKQLMKEAKQFSAFITEVAEAMKRHNVEDMLCVFGMNGDIRNTYIPLSEKGEKKLYCQVSDFIHELLQSIGFKKSGKPKHTTPITSPPTNHLKPEIKMEKIFMPKKRFAILPRVVATWRRTRALIWMQCYYIDEKEEKYCLRIGLLSREIR